MISKNPNSVIPTIARISPVLYSAFAILWIIIQRTKNSCFLLILHVFTSMVNFGLKNLVFKPLYKYFPKLETSFLNRGIRPNGAKSCGVSLTKHDKLDFSFGMPSGHSQITWTFTTYLICILCQTHLNLFSTIPAIEYLARCMLVIALIMMSLYISYSRVAIEGCHTVQQVIIGGMMGVVIGYLGFVYENRIMSLI